MSVLSPNFIIRVTKSRRMKWAGLMGHINAYKILVEKLEGKKPLGRYRVR
jgi:hypothetical protein